MSKRTQIGLLSILLLLMMLCMTFAAINTVQSIHDFQLQYKDVKAENVNTLRPWMTIPIVSHVYHVPEDDLCSALSIKETDPLRRATLYEIADRRKKPIDQVVDTLQSTIQTYRTKRPHSHQYPHLSQLERTRWSPTLLAMPSQEETNG